MCHEAVSQILLSSQFAPDLGDGPCGKNTLGFQTQRQERGEHFDQHSGGHTVALEGQSAELEHRFHDLPDTLNHMRLLPNMPDVCTTERSLTTIHALLAACCACATKDQPQCSPGGTIAPDATRWHVNAPWGLCAHADCFPWRRLPLLRVYRQDRVACACNDDVDTSPLMPPFSAFLRDRGRVHGQWKLSDGNPFTKKCGVELCQHDYEHSGFGRMRTTVFWTKQHRQR
jgi:hypothetical protein